MISVFNIIILIVLILLLPTAYAGLIGAPYAPTFTPAIRRALKFIKLGKMDTIVDLGAGDGKVLLESTKVGAQVVGYELSPIMWFIAKLRLLRTRGAKMYFKNFYKQSLPTSTTVIFIFLMPDKMKRVNEFLKKQNLPNAKYAVVYSFPFPDIKPLQVIHTPKCGRTYIYDLKSLISRN